MEQPNLFSCLDDGCVRVWKSSYEENTLNANLVTAWQAASESLPSARGAGLVLSWDARNLHLYSTGDSRNIQVWDINSEQRVQVRQNS